MTSSRRSKSITAITVDNDVDERMVPEKHRGSGIYGEHLARYQVARDIVSGKQVLDIACGSGYGTYALSKTAKSVVGVDVSKDAIDYAKNKYSSKNISYVKSDGKTVPFPDDTFDVITSFETIEHLDDYEQFMSELKRVLKKDGVLILSTPNELEFAEGNHFHLHEFEESELTALVKKYYSEVEHYYQSTWKGNLVGRKDDMSSEWQSKIDVNQLDPIENEKFLYFYLLCSDRPISESIQPLFTISQHASDKQIHAKEELTTNHINNLQSLLDAHKDDNQKKEIYIKELESRRLKHYLKEKISGLSRLLRRR